MKDACLPLGVDCETTDQKQTFPLPPKFFFESFIKPPNPRFLAKITKSNHFWLVFLYSPVAKTGLVLKE